MTRQIEISDIQMRGTEGERVGVGLLAVGNGLHALASVARFAIEVYAIRHHIAVADYAQEAPADDDGR